MSISRDPVLEPIHPSEAPNMSEVAGLADEVMIWSIIQDVEPLAATNSCRMTPQRG